MIYIETYTCVRFVARSNESDFVNIVSGDGCSSYLGKIGGGQNLSLQKNGCFSTGIIMHELIHALGYGKKLLEKRVDFFNPINCL
jgi:Astacin (Peptidase family M12A)